MSVFVKYLRKIEKIGSNTKIDRRKNHLILGLSCLFYHIMLYPLLKYIIKLQACTAFIF